MFMVMNQHSVAHGMGSKDADNCIIGWDGLRIMLVDEIDKIPLTTWFMLRNEIRALHLDNDNRNPVINSCSDKTRAIVMESM